MDKRRDSYNRPESRVILPQPAKTGPPGEPPNRRDRKRGTTLPNARARGSGALQRPGIRPVTPVRVCWL